jgi:glycerol uptake facilitator-like aquaporin
MRPTLNRRVSAEFFGTAFLVSAVVGSGIMAEHLFGGGGLALLANTIATGAALTALIFAFGPTSGAHFNPVVSVADALEGSLTRGETLAYVSAQISGGIAGTIATHLMFGLPLLSASEHVRSGPALLIGEFIASFGLLAVIWGSARSRPDFVPFAVGAYITAAYWFTSSTSFANPAVTFARCLSNTFAGIRPADVPLFVVAQFAGGIAATFLFRWLVPGLQQAAKQVLIPHDEA